MLSSLDGSTLDVIDGVPLEQGASREHGGGCAHGARGTTQAFEATVDELSVVLSATIQYDLSAKWCPSSAMLFGGVKPTIDFMKFSVIFIRMPATAPPAMATAKLTPIAAAW